MPEDRVNVLAVEISGLNMARALEMMEGRIAPHRQHSLCVTPAHVVMGCYREPDLYRLFSSNGLTNT